MKKIAQSLFSVAVVGASWMAVAADEGPHDRAIKARQAQMQLYGFNVGVLSAMAKGQRDYDADVAAEAAGNLASLTNLGGSQLWPQGSDSETAGNAENRALPKIWETYPEIAEDGKALKDAAASLAAVAGNGLDEMKGALGDVGKSCKGCHDDFRAEKK